MEKIRFERVLKLHQKVIFEWLKEPHILEFWDTSQAHKDDILNFIEGRKVPSSYCNGEYVYWIAFIDDVPFAMIMSIQEFAGFKRPKIKDEHLSKSGNTYSLDFMIGSSVHLGKGLGAKTLSQFVDFFRSDVDPQADTFFIDPEADNPRAKHVYEKAGFEYVGDFVMQGDGVFQGRLTHFLVKKIK